jgi:hypothetical protein
LIWFGVDLDDLLHSLLLSLRICLSVRRAARFSFSLTRSLCHTYTYTHAHTHLLNILVLGIEPRSLLILLELCPHPFGLVWFLRHGLTTPFVQADLDLLSFYLHLSSSWDYRHIS